MFDHKGFETADSQSKDTLIPTVTFYDIRKSLVGVGIEPGDIVYVAAFMAILGNASSIVDETIDALVDAVGPDGTIVMPTFNFGFCRGETFDRETTKSTCGVLTEAFRQRPEAKRTVYPPYHSVAAIGRHADEISRIRSTTSFGKDSVFHWLFQKQAKHVLLGCSHAEGVTHLHWLEEMFEVPYRFWKSFHGQIRVDGEIQQGTYLMFARRLDLSVQWGDVEIFGEEFEAAGFVQEERLGFGKIKSFRLRDFYEFMAPRMQRDKLLLLREDLKPLFRSKCAA
ncbi:AAC(3) family N-acetyltransferase [bacterium]|nr:AAC(3) family N-acetyltransferase [bacterium]